MLSPKAIDGVLNKGRMMQRETGVFFVPVDINLSRLMQSAMETEWNEGV